MNDVADNLQRTFPGLEGDRLGHLKAVAYKRFYPPDAAVVHEEEVGQTFFVDRELTQQKRFRSEFLTTVAHELRTPLASANGVEILIHATCQSGQVQLTISDRGVGIPADQVDCLFARFQRGRQVGPHLFGGVGLGLPLIKQVVEQHGGTIEVDSIEGQGSTFVMSLPAACQAHCHACGQGGCSLQ